MPRAVIFNKVNTMANVEYPARDVVVAPKGDDVTVIFDVYDKDGDEADISGVTVATFSVQEGQLISCNMYTGGQTHFTKTMNAGITKESSGYQFAVTINADDTEDLIRVHMYYELSATIDGQHKTIGAGLFLSPDTII